MQVVEVTATATYDLRRLVLRQGRADAEVAFDGDRAAGALHLAVVGGDQRPLAVATTTPAACPRRAGRRGWKVRGMAVEPQCRGRGLGGQLLREIEARARAATVKVLWADARDEALAFYERHGWSVEGEGYVPPTIDLGHHMVILDLDPADGQMEVMALGE